MQIPLYKKTSVSLEKGYYNNSVRIQNHNPYSSTIKSHINIDSGNSALEKETFQGLLNSECWLDSTSYSPEALMPPRPSKSMFLTPDFFFNMNQIVSFFCLKPSNAFTFSKSSFLMLLSLS